MNKDIGELFRKKREEKGLTLDDVHRATKVQVSILKDLEDGSAFETLEPIYAKSFVKLYANFLGLDVNLLLKDASISKSKEKKKEQPKKKEAAQVKAEPILTNKIKIPAISMPPKKYLKLIGAALLIILLIFSCSRIFREKKVNIKVKKISETPTQTVEEVTTEAQIPASDKIVLVIKSKEDCWLRVTADEKVVFQRVLSKGSVERWQADNKIELWVGNAAGIDVELNGQNIGPLGRRGQVIKNIVMTREGVSIGR